MQIISTNIAKSVTIEWRGQSIETGIFKYEVKSSVFLGTEDVLPDQVLDRRYHGGLDKACYLYSAEHYPYWKNKYPLQDWQWGMFGENLTVSELSESEIRIGDCYQIGDAVVQVSQPRQPCFKLGVRFGSQSVVDDFWISGFPGIYVRVLNPGNVKRGDELILIERNTESLSVADVFSVFRRDRTNVALMLRAIGEPFLAESCRNDIRKIMDNL